MRFGADNSFKNISDQALWLEMAILLNVALEVRCEHWLDLELRVAAPQL